jgi:single-strand DNA-binding protein
VSRSLNKVTLIGNLGSDPEVRSVTGGDRVANFSLATSRQWNDASGAKQEKTEWHRCVAWKQLADVVERYVKKGDKLYIEGRIEYRQYTDKDGVTKYATDINVRELIMLSPKGGGMGGGSDEPRSASRGAAPKAKAAATAGAAAEFEEFPGALQDEDDDLPF